MDKQKQIEEMEKTLYDYRFSYDDCIAGSESNLAKHLIEKGWIKPTENAVVLTREEYDIIDHNIKHLETVCNNLEKERNSLEEELSKYKERESFSQSLTEREWVTKTLLFDTVQTIVRNERQQARKETAEKFAERAKEEAFVEFMGEPIIRASKIDEIAKEFTEGNNGK